MRNHFIEGLKVKVQLQLLAQDPIENLDGLYWVAIDIDGQLYKMKRQFEERSDQFRKRRWFNPPIHKPPPATPSSDVMVVDVPTLGPNGKLSPSERTH